MDHTASSIELATLAQSVTLGALVDLGDLLILPLVAATASADAELLEEALAAGSTVTEVSEGGSVNNVRVEHRGRRRLLIIDGEEILGAKQNRTFNASFIIAPGATVNIPVSCVEAGRWGYRSAAFASAERTVSTLLRARKLERVTTSVTAQRGYDAEQGQVWNDVAFYLRRTGVSSPTGAFSDGARARHGSSEERLARLAPARGQIGFAAVRGDRLVAMDLFGSADIFARAWKKIARGLLLEVFDAPRPSRDPARTVRNALRALSRVRVVRKDAPGAGQTLHGRSRSVVVGAVVEDGVVYHAMVAPAQASAGLIV